MPLILSARRAILDRSVHSVPSSLRCPPRPSSSAIDRLDRRPMRTGWMLVLLACTACLRPVAPAVNCGPLPRADCAEAAEVAKRYIADCFPDDEIRSITFTDNSGAYIVEFADGTTVGVTP